MDTNERELILQITKLPLGLIINFNYAKLQWERVVLTR